MVQAAQLPSVQQYLSPEYYDREIRAFAREKVQLWVKEDLHSEFDPDQILVHTRSIATTLLPFPESTREEGRVKFTRHTMSLTDLALSNSTPLDSAYQGEVTLTDLQGKPLSPRRTEVLTSDYLKGMVRSLNLGKRYPEKLHERLLDSQEARTRLQVYTPLMRAQLRVQASEARIQGAGVGLSEAGFQAVEQALLKNLAAPAASAAGQLQIGGNTLRGLLVFRGPPAADGASRLVVYAPDAPGGRNFHEFANNAALAEGFINNPQLRPYLQSHVGFDNTGEVARLLQRGVRGSEMGVVPIKGGFHRRIVPRPSAAPGRQCRCSLHVHGRGGSTCGT